MSISSYSSIFTFGHKATQGLIGEEVVVEEKVDGSQFSFGRTESGTLVARSKGVELNMDAPDGMFAKAVEYVKSIGDLIPRGMVFRGEYLQKPKHNTLAYDRTPKNYIILFDVMHAGECYQPRSIKEQWAATLGLELVPELFHGILNNPGADLQLKAMLDRVSILGGQKIEGVVIKPANYSVFGYDKKLLIAKVVSEEFKEVHDKSWKAGNPKQGDILERLVGSYVTPARWNKAIQHLKESGQLVGEMKDLALLMKEVPADLKKECEDEIKQVLFNWAWPQLSRRATNGFPEYYRESLTVKDTEASITSGG
jgi:hypothetical protein